MQFCLIRHLAHRAPGNIGGIQPAAQEYAGLPCALHGCGDRLAQKLIRRFDIIAGIPEPQLWWKVEGVVPLNAARLLCRKVHDLARADEFLPLIQALMGRRVGIEQVRQGLAIDCP